MAASDARLVLDTIPSLNSGGTIPNQLRRSRPCRLHTRCAPSVRRPWRRTSLTRGNGTVTSYGYNPALLLTSLFNDFSAAGNDLTLTTSYNPAGQIVSRTGSNDLYAWTGHGSGTTPSSANGLNQFASHRGSGVTYDVRGNLVTEGTRTFTYSSENLLTEANVAPYTQSHSYDPLLRFFNRAIPGLNSRGFGQLCCNEFLYRSLLLRWVGRPVWRMMQNLYDQWDGLDLGVPPMTMWSLYDTLVGETGMERESLTLSRSIQD
jgi:hypothetical protein